jgi:hypothetical protein
LPPEYVTKNGQVISGWLERDQLPVARWIKQRASTNKFAFELDCRVANESDSTFEYFGLRVRDRKTGAIVQRFLEVSGIGRGTCSEVAAVADWNFDGYPDVTLSAHDGGAGPNFGYDFFLWDPKQDRYAYDSVFSGECQPTLDVAHKRVTFSSRGGCCAYDGKVFQVVDGTFRLVREWEWHVDTNDDDFIDEWSRTWENGEWHERKTRRRNN